jgi:choline kinase
MAAPVDRGRGERRMRAIVLAAGRGERLMPLTIDCPKSLVDLGGGRTLLEEQVLGMRASESIDEIVFVVGYQASLVERRIAQWRSTPPGPHLRAADQAPRLRTLFNPFFGVSNNLMSLWLARSEMADDFVVTNGDNLFAPDVYRRMLTECGDGVHLALSPKRQFDTDDMKAHVSRHRVQAVAKTLASARCRAESPGLVLVRGSRARAMFVGTLERLARDPENVSRFWLEVFNEMARAGTPAEPWYFDGTSSWQEIDFHADVKVARELLRSKLARLKASPLRRIA